MLVIRKLTPYVIILGTIAYVLMVVFGMNTLIVKEVVEGRTYYTLDFIQYSQNIQQAMPVEPMDFATIIPPRGWEVTSASFIEKQFWDTLINNLAFLLDWLYFPINFILYLIRWVAFALRVIFTILGWPMTKTNGVYDSVVIRVTSWALQNLLIPYI